MGFPTQAISTKSSCAGVTMVDSTASSKVHDLITATPPRKESAITRPERPVSTAPLAAAFLASGSLG
jgi:hypothetical protein